MTNVDSGLDFVFEFVLTSTKMRSSLHRPFGGFGGIGTMTSSINMIHGVGRKLFTWVNMLLEISPMSLPPKNIFIPLCNIIGNHLQ
ncbi:hypothetical protein AHAS_Ahas12G0272700 [Arachis hypogaea]